MSANIESSQSDESNEFDYSDSIASSEFDTSNESIQIESNSNDVSAQPAQNPPQRINQEADSLTYPQISPLDRTKVIIGPKGTLMSAKKFSKINWSNDFCNVCNIMLMRLFGSAILATHGLSSKRSPAFADLAIPERQALNPDIVYDMIHIIMTKCRNSSEKEIRIAIINKCGDEARKLKKREAMLLKTKENLKEDRECEQW